VGSNSYDYIFDLSGRAITQMNSNWHWSELYAAGLQVATYANRSSLDHSDWLGTARAHSGVTGSSVETCTIFYFGRTRPLRAA
jgi:hypothetical protein